MIKLIALVTIQIFMIATSVAAYPTLGNVSKVERELRVIPTRKAQKSKEIEDKLTGELAGKIHKLDIEIDFWRAKIFVEYEKSDGNNSLIPAKESAFFKADKLRGGGN